MMTRELPKLRGAVTQRLPKGSRGGIELLLVHNVEYLGKQGWKRSRESGSLGCEGCLQNSCERASRSRPTPTTRATSTALSVPRRFLVLSSSRI